MYPAFVIARTPEAAEPHYRAQADLLWQCPFAVFQNGRFAGRNLHENVMSLRQ